MTRDEYIKAPNSDQAYRTYYGQYVSDGTKRIVLQRITLPVLLASKDPHLNDIPLSRWDALVPQLHAGVALKRNGDWLSLGTGVCILKEAARQIIEEKKLSAPDMNINKSIRPMKATDRSAKPRQIATVLNPDHGRQAIITTFKGPTNFRGSRIYARAGAGRISIECEDALNMDQNHSRAAAKLADKFNWGGKWVHGGMPNGDHVFTMLVEE